MQLANSSTLSDILDDIYFNAKINASYFGTVTEGKIDANGNPYDLLRIVNKIYKQAQDEIRAVNEDFFLEISTLDLVADTGGTYPNEYPLPFDFEKIKQIQVALQPVDKTAPLVSEYQKCNLIGWGAITDPSYQDFTTPTCVMFDKYFHFFPLPASTLLPVTRGLKCFYIPLQADLANNTDVPNIFANYHDVITWGSLIDVATRLGDNNLLKIASEMYNKRKEEMRAYASSYILDIQPEYTEGQDQLGGWDFSWNNRNLNGM